MKTHISGYKISDLKEAFSRVADKINWKYPVKSRCNKKDVDILTVAIPFFTGSIAYFYTRKGQMWVKADGYYVSIGS
jgi:hypothetical protein